MGISMRYNALHICRILSFPMVLKCSQRTSEGKTEELTALGLEMSLGGAAAACRHRKDLLLRPFKVRKFDGFHMVPHDSTILQYFPRDETLDDSKFAMICMGDSAWFSKILKGSLRTMQLSAQRTWQEPWPVHRRQKQGFAPVCWKMRSAFMCVPYGSTELHMMGFVDFV